MTDSNSRTKEVCSDDKASSYVGFSDEELRIAIEQEKALEQKDADHRAFLAAKNSMESFILEMRMAPKRKFGETINASELNEVNLILQYLM